jgi:hypothetical protein
MGAARNGLTAPQSAFTQSPLCREENDCGLPPMFPLKLVLLS